MLFITHWLDLKKMILGHLYSAIILTIVMYNSADLSKTDVSKMIQQDVNALRTLSTIKSDIDQNMRQSQNNNADYVDYEDSPKYAYNNLKRKARGNESYDDDNSLVRVIIVMHRYKKQMCFHYYTVNVLKKVYLCPFFR